MIVLDSTTDNLQVVLNAAITTNQLQCVSSRRDITTTWYTPGRTVTNTNSTTDVNLVWSPAASTQRVIDTVSIYNNDTVVAYVTVKLDANGTERILTRVPLAAGERLEYSKKWWRSTVPLGSIKINTKADTGTSMGSWLRCKVMSWDQVIVSTTGNNMVELQWLKFKMDHASIYHVKLFLAYTMSSTSDGIVLGTLCPFTSTASVRMFLRLLVPTSTTAESMRFPNWTIAQQPATFTTSASTAGNICILEWYVWSTDTLSSFWDVSFWMGNDTTNGTLTVKKWSILYYEEVI